jgi:hypothetical protein
MIGVRVVGCS